MVSLIIPLLFFGFSSPACSDDENKPRSGRFITLRDYDFVGEDPTLRARLAERMAVLQAPLNLSELAPPPPPRVSAAQRVWQRWQRPDLPLQPDYLPSRLKLPQMVNVSMDYADILNDTDLAFKPNLPGAASGPAADAAPGTDATVVPHPGSALVPGPGAAPVPGPVEAMLPRFRAAFVPHPDGPPSLREALGLGHAGGPKLGSGPAPVSGPSAAAAPGDAKDGRRNDRKYNVAAYNDKLLDLMKHNIYATQRKMLELDSVIQRYEGDPRYRMAFIFNRLDEWQRNLRTLYYAMYRWRYYHLRVKRLIWYYEHSLRINIDITYSIEHLLHLHSEYMKKMEVIVPLSTRQEIADMKKAEKKRQKMKEMGFPDGYII